MDGELLSYAFSRNHSDFCLADLEGGTDLIQETQLPHHKHDSHDACALNMCGLLNVVDRRSGPPAIQRIPSASAALSKLETTPECLVYDQELVARFITIFNSTEGCGLKRKTGYSSIGRQAHGS